MSALKGAAWRAGYAAGLAEGRRIIAGWDAAHPPVGRHRAVAPHEWYRDMRARTGSLEPLPAPILTGFTSDDPSRLNDVMHLSSGGQMHPDEIDTLGAAAENATLVVRGPRAPEAVS